MYQSDLLFGPQTAISRISIATQNCRASSCICNLLCSILARFRYRQIRSWHGSQVSARAVLNDEEDDCTHQACQGRVEIQNEWTKQFMNICFTEYVITADSLANTRPSYKYVGGKSYFVNYSSQVYNIFTHFTHC